MPCKRLPSLRPCGRFNGPPGTASSHTPPSEQYALVIGNSHYKLQTLHNAILDIHLVSNALKQRGFTVRVAIDLIGDDLSESVSSFLSRIPPDAFCFLYFTGLIDMSVLLGVDSRFSAGAPSAGLALSSLISLCESRPGNTLLILDSARPVLGYRTRRLLSANRLSRQSQSFDFSKSGILSPPILSPPISMLLSHLPGARLPEEFFDPLCDPCLVNPSGVSIFAAGVADSILGEVDFSKNLDKIVSRVFEDSGRRQKPWLS